MSKFSKVMDIDVLAQPAMFVSSAGIITKVNSHLLKLLGFESKDLIDQNINLLITTKIMQPARHEVLVNKYHLNKESRIIGRPRVLPFKNSKDEEQFVTLQVIPLGKGKEYFFFCLLTDYFVEFKKMSIIPEDSLKKMIQSDIEKLEKSELFLNRSRLTNNICSKVETYLQYELHLISRYMIDNVDVNGSWKYAKYLLGDLKWEKLSKIYDLLLKLDEGRVAYLNLICMRLLFPILSAHSDIVRNKIHEFAQELYGDKQLEDLQERVEKIRGQGGVPS